ncbi:MAG: hypothetical protein J6A03_12060 [Lachnospiraceae bacterium]|nr:hypothetical protein [Lachnospiraceae bacterium]
MRIGTWIGMVCVTICAVGLMIFLPQYASKRVDAGMLNKVSTYAQEQTDTMNQGLSVTDKIQILLQSLENGTEIDVLSRSDLDNMDDVDKNLFTQLQQQIQLLEDYKLIPAIKGIHDVVWKYNSVVLKAYTSEKYPGKVLYVWNMNITIPDYGFLVVSLDASTYAVYDYYYQDEVQGERMQMAMESFFKCHGGADSIKSYMNDWMTDYMGYLGEEPSGAGWGIDSYGYNEENEDNGMNYFDVITGVGVVETTVECYFSVYLQTYGRSGSVSFMPDNGYEEYGQEYETDSESASVGIQVLQ